ncbi:MAG: fatty acid desaturase [Kastovskya adunca ATA6-11-RM4]|jgi:beta-carotene ketolase (CrtW type)|nr:fatty acid desaturase [Kastovskya adunca ATA6-11-RM4]
MRSTLPYPKSISHTPSDSLTGVFVASTILLFWVGSLIFLFSINVAHVPVVFIVLAVLFRIFIQTGLFITAHDAMHGLVFSGNRKINDFIGSVAIALYALLPYKVLLKKHIMHHRAPASADDPDFFADGTSNPVVWYFQFMKGYLDGKSIWFSMIGITVIFHSLRWLVQIPMSNLLLFWVVPSLISSVQLFYFGIYLPHRQPEGGYDNRHRARSSNYPVLWSFISCYHFGYHWEHHEYPNLPWYRLPSGRKD